MTPAKHGEVVRKLKAFMDALKDGCDENTHGIAVSAVQGHTIKCKKNIRGEKRWYVDGARRSAFDTLSFIYSLHNPEK